MRRLVETIPVFEALEREVASVRVTAPGAGDAVLTPMMIDALALPAWLRRAAAAGTSERRRRQPR